MGCFIMLWAECFANNDGLSVDLIARRPHLAAFDKVATVAGEPLGSSADAGIRTPLKRPCVRLAASEIDRFAFLWRVCTRTRACPHSAIFQGWPPLVFWKLEIRKSKEEEWGAPVDEPIKARRRRRSDQPHHLPARMLQAVADIGVSSRPQMEDWA
jgi:hypothetical protein